MDAVAMILPLLCPGETRLIEPLVIAGIERVGDAVFASGPLALLCEARPSLRVVLVTSPVASELVSTHPGVAQVVVVERRDGAIGRGLFVRRASRAVAVALLQLGVTPRQARFVALRDRRAFRRLAVGLGSSYLRRDITRDLDQGHRSARIAAALRPFGAPLAQDRVEPRLFTGFADEAYALEALAGLGVDPRARFVVCHPGSRDTRMLFAGGGREWGAERFAILCASLELMGLPVLLSAYGWSERRQAARIIRRSGGHARLLPELPPRTLARLLAKAAVCVSNDAGPLHLAAAMGTKCVGLFGSTDPDETGPVIDPRRAIVHAPRAGGACGADPPAVVQSVRTLLARS